MVIKKALLTILLLTLLATPITIASEQQTNWVTLLTTVDKTGNTQLQSGQPLLAGHTYNVTMNIRVPFTQNTSLFAVNLEGNMTRSGAQYWYVLTENYTGIDPFLYTPSEKVITFIQVEGNLKISVVFTIPQNTTTRQVGDITFRSPKNDMELVKVTVEGGAVVGGITCSISDSAIENYLNAVETKSNLIPNDLIDKSFEPLITTILAQADTIYRLGLPEQATQILGAIDPQLYPPPPDTTIQTALIAGVILLAIITIAITVTYTRLNTRTRFNLATIDETRDELASLEVTAERYDDNLANQLRRLREKLSESE